MSALPEHIDALDAPALYALWRDRDPDQWRRANTIHVRLVERLLDLGEPLLAFDVVREARINAPDDETLMTLEGLALARCGATERANGILRQRYAAGYRDEETVSLLARTHKDLGLNATLPSVRKSHLATSEALYLEAFAGGRSKRYWSGINAATLALIRGRVSEARSLSEEVEQICSAALAAPGDRGDRYWLHATRGEACLIRGELGPASLEYRAAVAEAPAQYGRIASTRRNARLILEATRQDPDFLDPCLPAPTTLVFSGHRIDSAGDRLRFPPEAERPVYAALRRYIDTCHARIGFASAACGADILFLEAMLEAGAEINIVLPTDTATFIRESVGTADDGRWKARFEAVLPRAKKLVYASQHSSGEVFLAYANVLLFGLAKSRAREVDGTLRALTVWDGRPGAVGGTASAIQLWRDCGQSVHAIHPVTLESSEFAPNPGGPPPSDSWLSPGSDVPNDSDRKLVSLLFADAVGFSKLTESQIPTFVTQFLGPIAHLLERATGAPIVRNTWGDALYFVFNDVRAAGRIALDICDLIRDTPWAAFGLPAEFGVRIGLHSGPAYPITDPIIRQFSYTGVHVSRAARIEPITPAGAVYASQEFAAVAEAVGVREFTCEYVGQTLLAKKYGEFPTYRVVRRG